MRLYMLAIISHVAIVSQFVRADEPLPSKTLSRVAQPVPSLPTLSQEQLKHLKAAADHLAKAGRKDEANKLLKQAAMVEGGQAAALLAKKEKELVRLQAEVEQLRKLAQRRTMISLSFHVIEVSPAKLKSASLRDFELLFLKGDGKANGFTVLEDLSEVEAAIDRLREKGLIKVLAAPTMASTSGQSLMFNSGAEVPVSRDDGNGATVVENVQLGTKIEAKPVLLDNGKLRLGVHLRVTDTSFDVMELQTAIDMEFDRVFMLRRLLPQPDPNANAADVEDGIETIVLITPKRIDGTEGVAQRPARTSYYPLPKGAVFPNPLGGAAPHIIHQEEEEERLIKQ